MSFATGVPQLIFFQNLRMPTLCTHLTLVQRNRLSIMQQLTLQNTYTHIYLQK